MIIKQIKSGLSLFVNTERAKIMQGFFKTKAGEYGEGDIFIGITIAQIRKIVKQYYKEADFKIIAELLHSAIHEERSLALYILTEKFQKTKNQNELDQIIDFYINPINLKWINNWDLVDISCYKILGKYIFNSPQKIDILYNFCKIR
jgi:3-methyladenine DNA glycosylase AlkD